MINFPKFSGIRCLMMPFIQGEPKSIPTQYSAYNEIVANTYLKKGDIGYLTIDESFVSKGTPQRGARAKYGRALHTEAGIVKDICGWGPPGWGGKRNVTLERNVKILVSSNLDDTTAVWDAVHENTSEDGDIGYAAASYPYDTATLLKAGEVKEIGIFTPHESLPVKADEVKEIGIFTPHESLPVKADINRQFLRIVGSGVHGREEYFTVNELMT